MAPGLPIEINPLDCDLTSSTSNLTSAAVILSYQPQLHTLQMETSERAVEAILISDLQGRQVELCSYSGLEQSVALQQRYQLGIYIVTVVFENGERVAERLLIY